MGRTDPPSIKTFERNRNGKKRGGKGSGNNFIELINLATRQILAQHSSLIVSNKKTTSDYRIEGGYPQQMVEVERRVRDILGGLHLEPQSLPPGMAEARRKKARPLAGRQLASLLA